MSSKKSRPKPESIVQELDTRLRKLGLDAAGFEKLAHDFHLVIEKPQEPPPVAELLKKLEPLRAEPMPKPPPAPVPPPVPAAAPPQRAARPPQPQRVEPPPPVIEVEVIPPPEPRQTLEPARAQARVIAEVPVEERLAPPRPEPEIPTPTPPPAPEPERGPAAASAEPAERVPSPPPPPPKEIVQAVPKPVTLRPAAAVLLAVAMAAVGWQGVRQWEAWLLRRAHRIFPLPFADATLLIAKAGRLDTVDPQRGLLFTLEAEGLRTLSIQKFSDTRTGGLAWGENCLWSTLPELGVIRQHQPSSPFAARRNFTLEDTEPTALTWDGRHLWAFDDRADVVREYAVGETLTALREYPLAASDPAGLYFSDGILWVAERHTRRVQRYRTEGTLTPHDTIDLGRWLGAQSRIAGVAVEKDVLWVLTDTPSEIHRLDLKLLRRAAQVPGGLKQ